MKNILSIIIIRFLFIVIDIPVKSSEIGTRKEISPIDWKNISATKLPLIPKIFLISWLSGKIKVGSCGEQVANEINSSIEIIIRNKPINSANLLRVKLTILLI